MTEDTKSGDRIAKVMARAGIASRRDAEKMILDGRVAVNGKKVDSPALDVLSSDKVTLDGKPIDAPQPARLWLYYKPLGLVTSNKDEKGRQTVFDTMPAEMPRVMSVGRLDLNSEGLLLLTNDGELKRKLELPSTGWLRKYRVRVNGRPNDATFDPLRRGVAIEGEEFQPMEVTLDRQQGANAWLTVGIREGKNREIRRAMAEVGLTVNRLIRVSYGPFRLNTMKPGDVVEVRQRVLRDQLGSGVTGPDDGTEEMRPRKPRAPRKSETKRDGKPLGPRGGGQAASDRKDFKPRTAKAGDDERGRSRPPRDRDEDRPRPTKSGDASRAKPRSAREDDGSRGARSFAKPRGERTERAGGRNFKARNDGDDAARRGPRPGGRDVSPDGKPARRPGDKPGAAPGKGRSGAPARKTDEKYAGKPRGSGGSAGDDNRSGGGKGKGDRPGGPRGPRTGAPNRKK